MEILLFSIKWGVIATILLLWSIVCYNAFFTKDKEDDFFDFTKEDFEDDYNDLN